MDYKILNLTSSIVSDNQISRRGGVILHEKTVCVNDRTELKHTLSETPSCTLWPHLHIVLQQGRSRLVLWIIHIPTYM